MNIFSLQIKLNIKFILGNQLKTKMIPFSMNFKCKSVQDEEKNSIRHLEETQPLIQESEEI